MKRSKKIDFLILALILAVFWCFFTSNLNFDGNLNKTDQHLNKREIGDNKREDIRELCQFLEHEYNGEEGDHWIKGNYYENDLKLRGIHVTFRHGERSPISKVEDPIGCIPYREEDREAFKNYQSLADSEGVRSFIEIDPLLKSFHRYPEYSNCVAGNLTAEGALQHVHLGKYFKNKYATTKLFTEENQRIVVEATTSQFYRTFQSVLAFSTEFLYPLRHFLAPIVVKASNATTQCLHDFCACPVISAMRHKYEKEHLNEFTKLNHSLKFESDEIRNNFQMFKEAQDPLQLIDVALGRFVCRRKSLPCQENQCLTIDFMNEIIEFASERAQRMFNEEIGIARRLQVSESFPVLSYLKQSLDQIRRFPHSNYIKIFSGHDTVVGPVARTLGLQVVDPPHYTSRIVVEVYEHKYEGLYLKFLYNGHNRSSEVRFCNGENLKYGMCKAEAFEQFMKTGIFKLMRAKSLKEACHL